MSDSCPPVGQCIRTTSGGLLELSTHMPPELLHVVGYLTGAALYAMLLSMAAREGARDKLTVSTAILGLGWNVGELTGHGSRAVGWPEGEHWFAACAFAALGFLPAVVIHSVARGAPDAALQRRTFAHRLTQLAYVAASIAAMMHLLSAAQGAVVPDRMALLLLTGVLMVLAPALVFATRRQPNGSRATWMTALAVFAVSALHVGNFHGPRESWPTELLGHHASIPLAFAILYQDYRFALADLFLKQALLLVAIVSVVFGFWSIVGPIIAAEPTSPRAIGLLLGLWVLSTYSFPVVRSLVNRFVDRVVLSRVDYARLVDEVTATLQDASTESDVLDRPCRLLEPALSASRVQWHERSDAQERHATVVSIPTTEAPHYLLSVSRLISGRRLLSDDVALLERVAALMGRRIDAMRLTGERYERVLREREMRGLATEAELRALRAQIHPHFLFNALTTIGYLIQEAPSRALDTLLRLTTLLRGVLRTDGEFTTLRREMELVECYLEIERERFEERLRVTLQVPSDLIDLELPTLVIQPLVENAIKHGIAHSVSGGEVSVEAVRDDHGFVRIMVRNTGAPFRGRTPNTAGGVGLRNVERRLVSHYGEAASLAIGTAANGETVAEVRLPLDDHRRSTTAKIRASA
jgi:signal transduction histidine kinase